jgi:hypothetical protein
VLPGEGAIFAIEVRCDGAGRELALHGELDLTGAPRLRAALELGQLEFIDCSGIGVIERARRQLRALGGDLTLRHPRVHVRRVLDLCADLPGPVHGRGPPAAQIEVPPAPWLGVPV